MDIKAIKNLTQHATVEALEQAELAILGGNTPDILIEGNDDGEQLTHVMAAKWILEEMERASIDFKSALRRYTQKVRNSIQ